MVINYQKRSPGNFFKIFIYLIIFFLFIFFIFFTFGLNLILNTSTYISNIFTKKEKTTSINPTTTLASIDLNYIPSATNSAKLQVSGNTINVNSLEFYLNEEKVKEIEITGDTFDEEIGDLNVGKNTFYIFAKDKDGKVIKKSEKYIIFYKNDKPKLEIIEPKDKAIINQSEIVIKGNTDKETFVKINQSPVVVDALGNFNYPIKLQEGENKILITAEDQAGNIEEKTLTVVYQKED
ncbi:MAG: hypothetical protein ACPL1D_01120 [Microgenomates group bacterium]